jgi:predicted outer membrane repeat protein
MGGGGAHLQSNLDGFIAIVDSEFSGNESQLGGGGMVAQVFNANSRFSINRSLFANNTTTSGGGGVTLSVGTGGTLEVSDSEFRENSTGGSGGGISLGSDEFISPPVVRFQRITVAQNSAAVHGGGISFVGSASAGLFQISTSTITNNSAGQNGGGIFIRNRGSISTPGADNVEIANSLIANNTAGGNGGGVHVQTAILAPTVIDVLGDHSSFELSQNTISGNKALSGGGLWLSDSSIPGARSNFLRHNTIAFNEATSLGGGVLLAIGTANIDNTIVAANVAPFGRNLAGLLGSHLNLRYSFLGSNDGNGLIRSPAPDANGNFIGGTVQLEWIDPRLGPLADNGGKTLTHALLPNSPARNRGYPTLTAGVGGVPVHDQRGEPFIRIFGGRIDIGAFEWLPEGFLPGDYNQDGAVNQADYSVWRNSMSIVMPPGSGADGNGDGQIDNADYHLWKSNFGATSEDLPSLPLAAGGAAGAVDAEIKPPVEPGANGLNRQFALPAEPIRQPPAVPGVVERRFGSTNAASLAAHDDALAAWLLRRRSHNRDEIGPLDDARKIRAQDDASTGDAINAIDAVFDELSVPA